MKPIFYAFILSLFLWSCNEEKTLTAQQIVDKSIEVSGGEKFKTSTIFFDFREAEYKAIRKNGQFEYSRAFRFSNDSFRDVLSNDGFKRFLNGEQIRVADSMIPRYSASVNSVHYFSVLPFGLNDSAVNKELLGEVTIKEQPYYKIKVFFSEEGGGEDFEDVFVYWIHKNTFKVEYLAYSYNEASGIGLRFREAYNERIVNGLRFVDYNNFKPEENIIDLFALDTLFEAGKLKLLSKIENENVEVE